ncbi:MAG: hypothetical protein ABI419_12465 [Ginsengibacter sp.]
MPEEEDQILQNAVASSFIGLQSYSEKQSKFFFGRDEEISRLTTLIKSNTLTIVFGKSGTGKTSLLNAGVFPGLREDYCLPFRIRLEFREDSPDLIAQIKNVLKTEIDKYGFAVKAYPSATETLWEYFHKEPLWKTVTPILVFDQFEEIFTLAKKNPHFAGQQLSIFWEELSNLIENQIPDSLTDQFLNRREQINYNYKIQPVKVLFAFREEFLPEFESIPSKIPSLKYSRFRLMPMNQNQAYDVITKTWGNKIDDAQAKKIITYFTNDEKLLSISDIEPSLLSQVCFYLDKERIAEGKDKITAEFLDKYKKETILRAIYNQVLGESYDAVGRAPQQGGKPVNENPVKVFVEDKLITSEGYRTKYALTQYDENIKPGIEVLKTKYFVRDDGKAVELTHDVLAPIIKVDREKRRKGIADIEAKKRARRKGIVIIVAAVLIGLGLYAFTEYERSKAQKEVNDLQTSIGRKKDSLTNIRNQLDFTMDSLKNLRTPARKHIDGNTIPTEDAAAIDSLQSQLKISNDQIASLKVNIDQINAQISEFKITNTNLLTDNESLKGSNGDLLRKINDLNTQLDTYKDLLAKWRSNFEKLQKEYYDYKVSHPYTYPGTNRGINGGQGANSDINGYGTTIANDLDSNSLKLKLYFSFDKKDSMNKLGSFPVYLIPDSRKNTSIIRDAQYYELRTNEDKLLKEAKGIRPAKFSNGFYYFPNLPIGNYLIKICTYYGGYYSYNKTKAGTESLTLNASPPIR